FRDPAGEPSTVGFVLRDRYLVWLFPREVSPDLICVGASMLRCFPVERRGTAFLVSYPHRYQHYRGPTEDQQFIKTRSDVFNAEYRGKVFVLNTHNQYQWRTKFL